MKTSVFLPSIPLMLLSALLVLASPVFCQEPTQEKKFFDVSLTQAEIYKYSNLKFAGDYTSFESPSGVLALGRTEAGVTIVIVLGGGTLAIDAPEAVKEKFTQVFGTQPLKTSFKTLYMRLHPKEFEETFGKMQLTKAPDEQAFAAAKQIYADRFLTSYHAGAQAFLPPYKTRVMDFDTADFNTITNEEGYWLTLRRVTPFASIYPRNFVNPKQK
jgi:hypothetical protein